MRKASFLVICRPVCIKTDTAGLIPSHRDARHNNFDMP
jgi:hypothetical protein